MERGGKEISKQQLGELLYPQIYAHEPQQCGKITGMLLEMPDDQILKLLENPDALLRKVQEAINVLIQCGQIPERKAPPLSQAQKVDAGGAGVGGGGGGGVGEAPDEFGDLDALPVPEPVLKRSDSMGSTASQGRKTQRRPKPADPLLEKTCAVCGETLPCGGMLGCPAQHYLCTDCLESSVKSQVDNPLKFLTMKGKVICAFCEGDPAKVIFKFHDKDIFERISDALYERVSEQKGEIHRLMHEEREKKLKERLEGEGRRILSIREEIGSSCLTIRCPNCDHPVQPEQAFDQCFALYCDSNGCKGLRFCGWCLHACGKDSSASHTHVRDCPKNNNPGSFFPSTKNGQTPVSGFNDAHRETRMQKLTAFLKKLPPEDLEEVKKAIEVDVRELGIALPAVGCDAYSCAPVVAPPPATRGGAGGAPARGGLGFGGVGGGGHLWLPIRGAVGFGEPALAFGAQHRGGFGAPQAFGDPQFRFLGQPFLRQQPPVLFGDFGGPPAFGAPAFRGVGANPLYQHLPHPPAPAFNPVPVVPNPNPFGYAPPLFGGGGFNNVQNGPKGDWVLPPPNNGFIFGGVGGAGGVGLGGGGGGGLGGGGGGLNGPPQPPSYTITFQDTPKIQLLMGMGFERDRIVEALKANNGNAEDTLNSLLSPSLDLASLGAVGRAQQQPTVTFGAPPAPPASSAATAAALQGFAPSGALAFGGAPVKKKIPLAFDFASPAPAPAAPAAAPAAPAAAPSAKAFAQQTAPTTASAFGGFGHSHAPAAPGFAFGQPQQVIPQAPQPKQGGGGGGGGGGLFFGRKQP